MLKGNNKLLLNEATMRAAIEEYLNNRILNEADDLNVTGVAQSNDGYSKTFEVSVEESKEEGK